MESNDNKNKTQELSTGTKITLAAIEAQSVLQKIKQVWLT